jgi:hypothetical protein
MTGLWQPTILAALVGAGASTFGAVVALGGSFLRDWRQRKHEKEVARREGESARKRERAAVYNQLLYCSYALADRVGMLRLETWRRGGLGGKIWIAIGARPELDALTIYEWVNRDAGPMREAWSRIWALGSQAAIDAADRLVTTSGELYEAATALPTRRDQIAAAVGMLRWDKKQQAVYNKALRQFSEARVAFVTVAREEIGVEAVELALERAQKPPHSPRTPTSRVEAQRMSEYACALS